MQLRIDDVLSFARASQRHAETGARSQLLTPWVRAEVAPHLRASLVATRDAARVVEPPHLTGELVEALHDIDHAITAIGRAPTSRADHRDALAAARRVVAALEDSQRAAVDRARRPAPPPIAAADVEEPERHLLTGYVTQ